jgi:hypothetical protein
MLTLAAAEEPSASEEAEIELCSGAGAREPDAEEEVKEVAGAREA